LAYTSKALLTCYLRNWGRVIASLPPPGYAPVHYLPRYPCSTVRYRAPIQWL